MVDHQHRIGVPWRRAHTRSRRPRAWSLAGSLVALAVVFTAGPGLAAEPPANPAVSAATLEQLTVRPVGLPAGVAPADLDGSVRAATVWDDGAGPALYLGGFFTNQGCCTPVNRIVRWDGTEWSTLGSGLNNGVLALTAYDGDLIAGGQFSTAGGVAVNNIARWDGTEWSPLGEGTTGFPCCGGSGGRAGQVAALTVFDGELIAGGTFAEAGGVEANMVARWDGATWSAMGEGLFRQGSSPLTPSVTAFGEWDGELLAAGRVNSLARDDDREDEDLAGLVVRWDGSTWSPLGDGFADTGTVFDLAEHDGHLVAGGSIRELADGTVASRIARWDGTAWAPFPPGAEILGTQVSALQEYQGVLMAGGGIVEAGTVSPNHIAGWDGGAWSTLAGPSGVGVLGSNTSIRALELFDGDLVAVGDFHLAGGEPALRVARWNGQQWSAMVPKDEEPPDASQDIVAVVPEEPGEGSLVISVDPGDRTVTLPELQLAAAGDRLATGGDLRPVTVTDTRAAANPGWDASAQATDFTGDGGSFGGGFLGWTPDVASHSEGQEVTPGAPVPPGFPSGDGLSVSQTLATGSTGAGVGTAVLGAGLRLEIPVATPAGTYTAVLTLTAI